MTRHKLYALGLVSFAFMAMLACSSDDTPNLNDDVIINPIDTIPDPDGPIIIDGALGRVELYNATLASDDVILVNDASANRVFVMNKEAGLLHEWPLSNNIGNDAFLLPDARLLASLETDEPKILFGGKGGQVQFVDKDGNIEWQFIYSSPQAETHHDVELLPNGNIIAMVWELRTEEEAMEAGFELDAKVYPEAVIEIDPSTDEIVWEWHAWDHMIQDYDDTKANFGVISDNPQRIDLNYVLEDTGNWPNAEGDLMHANALAYDSVNDLIYISVNFYSEVWVIDHSTTTEQAAGTSGGNYGKGGDLLYRFGNPSAYDNTGGERLFHSQHHPLLLTGADQGKMLIFSNGNHVQQSTVYELEIPSNFELIPGTDNEPAISWEFTDPDLFAPRVSGAVPMSNGNLLIAEGDFGYWEVTRNKEVVWKFEGDGFYWRGYPYARDASEIAALDITF